MSLIVKNSFLTPEQRRALIAAHEAGLSGKLADRQQRQTLAAAIGLTEGTVKNWLNNQRRKRKRSITGTTGTDTTCLKPGGSSLVLPINRPRSSSHAELSSQRVKHEGEDGLTINISMANQSTHFDEYGFPLSPASVPNTSHTSPRQPTRPMPQSSTTLPTSMVSLSPHYNARPFPIALRSAPSSPMQRARSTGTLQLQSFQHQTADEAQQLSLSPLSLSRGRTSPIPSHLHQHLVSPPMNHHSDTLQSRVENALASLRDAQDPPKRHRASFIEDNTSSFIPETGYQQFIPSSSTHIPNTQFHSTTTDGTDVSGPLISLIQQIDTLITSTVSQHVQCGTSPSEIAMMDQFHQHVMNFANTMTSPALSAATQAMTSRYQQYVTTRNNAVAAATHTLSPPTRQNHTLNNTHRRVVSTSAAFSTQSLASFNIAGSILSINDTIMSTPATVISSQQQQQQQQQQQHSQDTTSSDTDMMMNHITSPHSTDDDSYSQATDVSIDTNHTSQSQPLSSTTSNTSSISNTTPSISTQPQSIMIPDHISGDNISPTGLTFHTSPSSSIPSSFLSPTPTHPTPHPHTNPFLSTFGSLSGSNPSPSPFTPFPSTSTHLFPSLSSELGFRRPSFDRMFTPTYTIHTPQPPHTPILSVSPSQTTPEQRHITSTPDLHMSPTINISSTTNATT